MTAQTKTRLMIVGVIAAGLALSLVLTLWLSSFAAHAGAPTNERWDHYRSRLSGNVLVVKGRCLAEDSVAHLRPLDYRDHGAHIVLGCAHKGY